MAAVVVGILFLLLPVLAVFGVGRAFPMQQPERRDPLEPPGYVFGIVWAAITVLVGLATGCVIIVSGQVNAASAVTATLEVLLVAAWCGWVPLYGRVPPLASRSLLAGSALLAGAHAVSVGMLGPGWTRHLSWPLLLALGWLTFAASLST